MGWLFSVIFFVLFVVLFLYLRRRRAELAEEEDARAQAFFDLVHGERGQGVVPEASPVGDIAVQVPASRVQAPERPPMDYAPPPPPVLDASSERTAFDESATGPVYLERPYLLVWRWLRMALPEHECFARGSLRRVVGRDRAQKDMMVDFVICDAACRVVAVVDLERRGQEGSVHRFKRELLNEAGVRYACWSASQLPERDEVREWIRQPLP